MRAPAIRARMLGGGCRRFLIGTWGRGGELDRCVFGFARRRSGPMAANQTWPPPRARMTVRIARARARPFDGDDDIKIFASVLSIVLYVLSLRRFR